MDRNTWIHIGFPKCASTALQKDFFSQCPEIDYVGRWKNWTPKTDEFYSGNTLKIASLADRYYEKDELHISSNLLAEFDHPEASIRLLSDEGLTGGFRPFIRSVPLVDASQVAHRLAKLFPHANILMILRNQLNFIPSFFGQITTHNESIDVDPESFLHAHSVLADAGLGTFFHICDYASIYECYEDAFGGGKVHVLLQEDLAADAIGFMTRLVDLLGLSKKIDPTDYLPRPHNTQSEQVVLTGQPPCPPILRKLGRLAPAAVQKLAFSILSAPYSKPAKRMELSAAQERFLRQYYGTGNYRLQKKLIGTPLSDAGYPILEQNEYLSA
jgi:hypothetical protein